MSAIDRPLPRYTLFEDLQGLAVSVTGGSLGMVLLAQAGLVTGGTAGLALLLSYVTGWGFGWLFFVINLPFYLFAFKARGAVFAVKSLGTVVAVSLIVEYLPDYLQLSYLHPGVAALLYGAVAGVGVLGLYRHGSSLGGVSILAIICQDRFGIRAGWIQLSWDIALFAVAALLLPVPQALWSLVGAAVLNTVLAMNHRRDWYLPG